MPSQLKYKLLLKFFFKSLCVSLVEGKTANYHVLGRVAWEVETARNWFGSILFFFNYYNCYLSVL